MAILDLLKGDASTTKGRKQAGMKVRHDVASCKKDFPLKNTKLEASYRK